MMTSMTMRILKDNEIVCADLDDNTNCVDFEDESDEEEEDSEKSVGVTHQMTSTQKGINAKILFCN